MAKTTVKTNEVTCPKCGTAIDIKAIIKAGTQDAINKELLAQEQKHKDELQKLTDEKKLLEAESIQKEDNLKKELEKKYKEELVKKEATIKEKLLDEQKEAQNVLEKELEDKTNQLKDMNKLKAEMSKLEREKATITEDLNAKFQEELSLVKSNTESEIKKELLESEKRHKDELTKKEVAIKAKLLDEQKEAQSILEQELEEKTNQLKEMNKLKAEMSKLEREKATITEELNAKFQKDLSDNLTIEKTKLKQNLESEHELKILEYKKQLDDQKILIEEMKRKHEQGSMQLQGEVQELAIEAWLKQKFPTDTIEEVGKGKKGADCLQTVNNRGKYDCGKIYYESKRTKNFGSDWIDKFKQDIKEKKADIGVLVTQVYPQGMDRMGLLDGIYVCSYEEFKGLSVVLRENIIQMSYVLSTQENRSEKAEILYNFLTGNEFKMQVEGIIKTFVAMKNDLETEKVAFQKIWKKREKQLEIVTSNTAGMIGSIQGYANTELEGDNFLSIAMTET